MQCAVREGADHGAAERGDGHRSCLPWLKSCRTLPAKVAIYIDFLIRLIFVRLMNVFMSTLRNYGENVQTFFHYTA